jgi:hypothetical protein
MKLPLSPWRNKTRTARTRRTPYRNRPSQVTWTGVVVEVVDRFGNQVLPSPKQPLAGSVTLALACPSNQLNGTLKQDINPDTVVASFTDLAVVTTCGGYTLQATNAAVPYPF